MVGKPLTPDSDIAPQSVSAWETTATVGSMGGGVGGMESESDGVAVLSGRMGVSVAMGLGGVGVCTGVVEPEDGLVGVFDGWVVGVDVGVLAGVSSGVVVGPGEPMATG